MNTTSPYDAVTLQTLLTQGPLERGAHLRDQFGLLLEDDIVVMLGIEKNTLRAWRSEGKGPDFTRLGKSVYYHADDVKSWINRSKVVTGGKE